MVVGNVPQPPQLLLPGHQGTMDNNSWALIHRAVGCGSLGLVLLLSLPSFRQVSTKVRFARRQRGANGDGSHEVVPDLFESVDGKATEESVAAFSDRKPRVSAAISLCLGLAASITAAILATLAASPLPAPAYLPWVLVFDRWADVPAWTLIAIQWASIPTKAQYDRRFSLAVIGFLSSIVLLASLGYRYGFDIVVTLSDQERASGRGAALGAAACRLLQVLAAIATAFSFSAFPHRPDVYYNGLLVDQQHAVSILSRFGFNWNSIVFEIANARKLELEDLPGLDGDTRSANVNARYLARGDSISGPKGRLWWQLVMAYKWPLVLQWILTFIRAVLAMFPQFVIYQFLENLGNHTGGNMSTSPKLWGWVIGIGVSLGLQIWVSSIQRWLTSSRLEAPVNSLIQSLVFQKALRLDEAADPGSKVAVGGSGKDGKDGKDAKDAKEAKKNEKSNAGGGNVRQSVVNHMKLDR